ncbi:hypothetical protein ABIC27_003124 [Streptomyces sp. PvR034]
MDRERRLPVVIVAGMHAGARNEAVERLLRAVSGSMAAHHDLSGVSDGTVLRGA